MAEGDEGGAGGVAEVVVVAVAEEEAPLPSFMVRRYPSTRRIFIIILYSLKANKSLLKNGNKNSVSLIPLTQMTLFLFLFNSNYGLCCAL